MFKNIVILCVGFLLVTSCKLKKIEVPDLSKLSKVSDEASSKIKEVKEISSIKPKTIIDPIQNKYADILGTSPKEVKNIELFKFIDGWMGTKYKMGGENRLGIDCSFFTQFLYHDVYNMLIERTAEKQYSAPSTDKFIGQEYLKQGDLLFFNLSGSQYDIISHVGVYLGDDKFVHSTSRRADHGKGNGVQISNFKDPHWQKLFVAAGRKSMKVPKN